MRAKRGEAERFHQAPQLAPRRRLDETRAARRRSSGGSRRRPIARRQSSAGAQRACATWQLAGIRSGAAPPGASLRSAPYSAPAFSANHWWKPCTPAGSADIEERPQILARLVDRRHEPGQPAIELDVRPVEPPDEPVEPLAPALEPARLRLAKPPLKQASRYVRYDPAGLSSAACPGERMGPLPAVLHDRAAKEVEELPGRTQLVGTEAVLILRDDARIVRDDA